MSLKTEINSSINKKNKGRQIISQCNQEKREKAQIHTIFKKCQMIIKRSKSEKYMNKYKNLNEMEKL